MKDELFRITVFMIFNEKLPWLKYNKPNLPREELEKINKHAS
ncbi:unnamed protein product [Dibothriocephalus latus]|uniref:Uncharacterized protein n=1 Tax=Dibothriocephalus latus TaxID=60516 RepID=A0A3P7P388_DIBLA|nr:unnamed protein product [Dibothriocephalus latus]